MIEDSNRTDTVPQFCHIALTAVTAVDIGTIHAFLGGCLVRKQETYASLHSAGLDKAPTVVYRLRTADPPCGSQFGPCGFCGEPSGTDMVLLSPPVGVIPPMAPFSPYLYSAFVRRTSGRILEAKHYPSLL